MNAQTTSPCRNTPHCRDHGFCEHCDPELNALGRRVLEAVISTEVDYYGYVGLLYTEVMIVVREHLRGLPPLHEQLRNQATAALDRGAMPALPT